MTPTVLLAGGTGRTGCRVLEQLLQRGAAVRAIVRSAARLPAGLRDRPGLSVIEEDLLALPDAELARQAGGCDAIVSCLGHNISLAGVFGPPHDLVTRATARLCRAAEASRPDRPIRFVLMSSVSANHPGGGDPPRTGPERALLWVLARLVPPVRDNQRAPDFLFGGIGASHPFVEWVVVRPDTLLEGGITEYVLHGALPGSLFRPDSTNMANVAHFICELVTNDDTWHTWKGRLPVIVNRPGARA